MLRPDNASVEGREMKLARFLSKSGPAIGVVSGEGIIPIAEVTPEHREMRQLAASGPDGIARLADAVANREPTIRLADVKLLPPMERPGKFLGIGLNYRGHTAEAERVGVPMPAQQLWFNKQTTCLAGPFDDIDPGVTQKLDYEVELGFVIGLPARYVAPEDAARHVFGYFVANDVSARDWQFHSSTHTMGKSFDTHGPIGPWIVTPDELPDPHNLEIRCYVNGELRQRSNTNLLVHTIWDQIEYLSAAFTLEPGDLIITGTPEGVGAGMEPEVYLKENDVVRCEIDSIGAIENRVAAAQPRRLPRLRS